jgi:hypothetical protein
MTTRETEPGQSIMDAVQKAPQRWHVRIITATPGGTRVQHHECTINAPDQLTAVAVAMHGPFREVEPGRWDDVHILVEPTPPQALTTDDIVNRAEERRRKTQ